MMKQEFQLKLNSNMFWIGISPSENKDIEIGIESPKGEDYNLLIKEEILFNFKIIEKLKETIDFLKVESIGGVWNTPQLITMLEDILKK